MFCGYAMAVGSIRASHRLFSRLCATLLHAPMLFFDSTPRGRILNRVADDISVVDRVLPFTVRSIINCVLAGLASLFVVSFATPWFLLSTVPLAIVYYYIQVTCCLLTAACERQALTNCDVLFLFQLLSSEFWCFWMSTNLLAYSLHWWLYCLNILYFFNLQICFISRNTDLYLLLRSIRFVSF